jgi:hypothetical protein
MRTLFENNMDMMVQGDLFNSRELPAIKEWMLDSLSNTPRLKTNLKYKIRLVNNITATINFDVYYDIFEDVYGDYEGDVEFVYVEYIIGILHVPPPSYMKKGVVDLSLNSHDRPKEIIEWLELRLSHNDILDIPPDMIEDLVNNIKTDMDIKMDETYIENEIYGKTE